MGAFLDECFQLGPSPLTGLERGDVDIHVNILSYLAPFSTRFRSHKLQRDHLGPVCSPRGGEGRGEDEENPSSVVDV